jgi:hypothetical protein
MRERIIDDPEHGSTLVDETDRGAHPGESVYEVSRSVCSCVIKLQSSGRCGDLRTDWIDAECGVFGQG